MIYWPEYQPKKEGKKKQITHIIAKAIIHTKCIRSVTLPIEFNSTISDSAFQLHQLHL